MVLPRIGGGQLTRRPNTLTHSGELVVVCNAERIRVYSALSGEFVFEMKGHADEVTGVWMHPYIDDKVRNKHAFGGVSLHRWLICPVLNDEHVILYIGIFLLEGWDGQAVESRRRDMLIHLGNSSTPSDREYDCGGGYGVYELFLEGRGGW